MSAHILLNLLNQLRKNDQDARLGLKFYMS